jgi:hypothetical protein
LAAQNEIAVYTLTFRDQKISKQHMDDLESSIRYERDQRSNPLDEILHFVLGIALTVIIFLVTKSL